MVDKTFVTMPYDFMIELIKIGGFKEQIFINQNGVFDVSRYSTANVAVLIPVCTLTIVNNSSKVLRSIIDLDDTGHIKTKTVDVAQGKRGNIFGLLDTNGNISGYSFSLRAMGDIKVASAQGSVRLTKTEEGISNQYICEVWGEDEEEASMTLVFTDA